jgi:hypothetical protein
MGGPTATGAHMARFARRSVSTRPIAAADSELYSSKSENCYQTLFPLSRRDFNSRKRGPQETGFDWKRLENKEKPTRKCGRSRSSNVPSDTWKYTPSNWSQEARPHLRSR